MNTFTVVAVSLALVQLCAGAAQYQERDRQYDQYDSPKPPPPQILSHKQALNHDGNFKYLFTSENGLAQGESISPDGSRNGGYSYVDPTGRKISVKYTAGKEGFRILEADHLPKAPQPIGPVPGLPAQPQPSNYAPALLRQGGEDDGQYRPRLYQKPQPQPIYTPQASYQRPYSQLAAQPSNNLNNAIQEKEIEYNDEPGKPHSFGSGYIFEFGG